MNDKLKSYFLSKVVNTQNTRQVELSKFINLISTSELQIRGGIEDNSKIIFLISQ